jgi:hypothetical protein
MQSPMPSIDKKNINKIIEVGKSIIKNRLNKKINFNVKDKNLKLKLTKYFKEKFKIYKINKKLQDLFFKSLDVKLNSIQNPKKVNETKESYIKSKKEIDKFIKKTDKDPRKDFGFYMIELNKIFKKHSDLDKNDQSQLITYAFNKKNISVEELEIMSLENALILLEKISKFIK